MLWIEPVSGTTPIIQFIQEARGTLDINAYMLTDRKVLASIAEDVRGGVKVRILIDRRPYGGRPRNELSALRATGATVRFAPPRFTGRYRFDHAKYMVSGQNVEIGTANLTWSAFHKNREYLWVARQGAVAGALKAVFNADWTNRKAGAAPHATLVLSPGATSALVGVIDQPGPLCIETEELSNDKPLLTALSHKGAAVQLLLPARINGHDRRIAHILAGSGVQVRYLATPYLHAKLVLGRSVAFIGSENFSWTSLNRNREVGVLLQQPAAGRLLVQCSTDWRNGRP
ncbi:MAG: phospholipase D-like domain-containing protein [Acidiferrobacterales bacterium]